MVDGEHLAGREAALGLGEAEADGAVRLGAEAGGRGLVAIAHAGEDVLFAADGLVDPGEVPRDGFARVEPRSVRLVEGDVQGVGREILLHDDEVFVVGVGRQADALALADGVAVQAAMLADRLAGGVRDRSGGVGDMPLQEVLHRHLAEEADALAVLAFGVRQLRVGGELAHLGLQQFADREDRLRELFLAEQREEVGLILVRVEAFEEVERPVGVRAATRVMAGRDDVEAVLERLAQEDPELHLAVADDVGVRGEALAVAVDQVLDDRLTVVLDEVDDPEGQAEVLCYRLGVAHVVLPRAFAGEGQAFLVHPGAEVGRMHLMPLLLQQKGRHGAIDAAGEGYQDLGHRGQSRAGKGGDTDYSKGAGVGVRVG